ncbi:MAG: ATP-dependent DNA helicase RecG [Spirochaetota bacterium]|nr:ATP-dependent DNA helicase RecG [Spirochaetota bacterium]
MLNNSVQNLQGVGTKKGSILKNDVGIDTIEDLLFFAPRRYVDRSSFKSIVDTFVNDVVTVAGIIKGVNISGRKRRYLEVEIDDGTDTLLGIFFGGIKYFEDIFRCGDLVLFSGKINFYRKKQMVHPDYDFIDEESHIQSINTGRVIPLYRSSANLKRVGLDSRGFRRIIRKALDRYLTYIEDPLDAAMLNRFNLISLQDAVFSIHFPDTFEKAEQARKRLAFNEMFFLQYYLAISRKYYREEFIVEGKNIDPALYNEFISSIPFELTDDQKCVIDEIKVDMENPFPMNRLLQGDVGSGKTVVAMAASQLAFARGDQTAVMAPTELLANQHYENFNKMLPSYVSVSILTGNTSKSDKKDIYDSIIKGEIDIVIGTHALIQEAVSFKKLGLIIIDEQHRFGVNQRAKLRSKGESPDLLVLTATPIPRSLSLTLYGDLDVSYIKEKPTDRPVIKTLSFPQSQVRGVYNSLEKYIKEGRQVYYVLPIIEESEKVDLKSALEVYDHLKNEIFHHRRVSVLHGRMSGIEKNEIMYRFNKGEIDILVTTTVIEVGIDIANASIMVIEHAERFGLSQLHQLRGRVGRGRYQSFCILLYPDNITDDSRKRIETIVASYDGFQIAEQDLKSRGSGEFIGIKQHGHSSGFEFTDLFKDLDLIKTARSEAEKIVSGIKDVHKTFDEMQDEEKYISLMKSIRTKRVLAILS